MIVRTRFAPSPTGYAHLGFVSRVLINYAMARKHGGKFVWRNEDTDRERFVEGSLEFNMRWMREFGLDWDEGPDIGGSYAPYNQSERLDIYKNAAEKLIEKGYAYRCFCSKERLSEMREEQEKKKERKHYDGLCRNISASEIESNLKKSIAYTVRVKMPRDRKIEFDDIITRTHITWNSNEVDDYILLKSDGYPTYHLAAVVDDAAMEISHVFRGSEWIATTPVHQIIYEGLGITEKERPGIGHFTVILDPSTPGKKFSKRSSSFKANGLVIQGYLKPAILNYLMLLGWAPKDDRELFTLKEFVEAFDLSGMQKANPTWDQNKMDWFNGIYIRALSPDNLIKEFTNWITNYLFKEPAEDVKENLTSADLDVKRVNELLDLARVIKDSDRDALKCQLLLTQERSINFWHTLSQIEFFYRRPEKIDWQIKQLNKIKENLEEIKLDLISMYSSMDDNSSKWMHAKWEKDIRRLGDKYRKKHGDIFMLLRVSITGGPFSPPLFESSQILGKEECLIRLKNNK